MLKPNIITNISIVNIDNKITFKSYELSIMKEGFLKYYQVIGENVRLERQKKGFSQEQLASNCSVNAAKISRIENARRDYMFSTILEIAQGLDVDPKKLLDFDSEDT